MEFDRIIEEMWYNPDIAKPILQKLMERYGVDKVDEIIDDILDN